MSTELFEPLCRPFFDDALKFVREKAWDRFLEIGFKDELFKYVPLRRFYELELQPSRQEESRDIAHLIYPECRTTVLVFINGYFAPHLSNCTDLDPKIVVLPLTDAIRSYGPFLQNRWSRELDPFALLNLAAHPQGCFVYIPPKTVVQKPIQILHVNSQEGCVAAGRLHLFLGSMAKAEVVTTISGSGIHNNVVDVVMEDRATCSHYDIALDGSGWYWNSVRALLKKESRFHHLQVTRDDRITRHCHTVALQGEGGEAQIQGVWELERAAQIHTHVEVDHAAPHAHSLQKFKGILDGQSRSSFEGKIKVDPIAQKTEAYQLNNNLLLSDSAIAYTKPNLEIFADDVKASHGATIAQIDEEELFYLKSRGVSSEEARRLLMEGFLRELTDQIPLPSVRERLHV